MTVYEQVSEWLNARGWTVLSDSRGHLAGVWFKVAERYGDESPAACGCLLALVREAWPGCEVDVEVLPLGAAVVSVWDRGNSRGRFGVESLGHALTAALRAAPPRWTRGSLLALADARVQQTGCERPGQALFNVLFEHLPGLAEQLRGGAADPFHCTRGDDRWNAAIAAIDQHLAVHPTPKAGEP